MKETRRRFIVLFCLVSLAHGVLLAGAAPLFRRSAGPALPGRQTLIVSVAPAAKPAPSPEAVPRIESRPAPIKKTSPPPPRPAALAPSPTPAPRVRPRPRRHAVRRHQVRRHTARRIKPRPGLKMVGHPASAVPAVTRAPVRVAHLGTAGRPGIISPDTRAVCLNGHIFKSHYPEWARQRGWQGRVILKILVTTEGRVGRVETVRRSDHDLLNRTAVRIARWLRFKPARRGGRPIASWVRMPVRYVIVEPD